MGSIPGIKNEKNWDWRDGSVFKGAYSQDLSQFYTFYNNK